MDGMSGIEAAQMIRVTDRDAIIVFLTTSEDHMPDAFRLHAYEYIVKPVRKEDLFPVMDDILKKTTPVTSPSFSFPVREGEACILFDDLVTVGTDAHNYLEIFDKDGNEYLTRMAFAAACDHLQSDKRFLQVRRGVIVNMAYQYLKSYRVSMPKNEAVNYCDNTALNALLNYYGEAAHQHRIRLRIVADLPENLPLSDVDLCNIVGNILDNAITACLDIPETDRYINLSISCPNDVRFGIVSSNSFSGKVRMDGDRYLSTHRGGSGIGLESIRTAAQKYGGNVNFRHEGKEFISGVVIPIK